MNIGLVIHKKTQNINIQYMNKMNKGSVIISKFNKIYSVARKFRVKGLFSSRCCLSSRLSGSVQDYMLIMKCENCQCSIRDKLFLHIECKSVCCVSLQVVLSKMQRLRCVLMLRVHVLYLVLYFAVLAGDRSSMYQDLEQCFV